LHGATAQPEKGSPKLWTQQVEAAIESGQDRKVAIKAVAQRHGVPKRAIFDALERAKTSEDENELQV